MGLADAVELRVREAEAGIRERKRAALKQQTISNRQNDQSVESGRQSGQDTEGPLELPDLTRENLALIQVDLDAARARLKQQQQEQQRQQQNQTETAGLALIHYSSALTLDGPDLHSPLPISNSADTPVAGRSGCSSPSPVSRSLSRISRHGHGPPVPMNRSRIGAYKGSFFADATSSGHRVQRVPLSSLLSGHPSLSPSVRRPPRKPNAAGDATAGAAGTARANSAV